MALLLWMLPLEPRAAPTATGASSCTAPCTGDDGVSPPAAGISRAAVPTCSPGDGPPGGAQCRSLLQVASDRRKPVASAPHAPAGDDESAAAAAEPPKVARPPSTATTANASVPEETLVPEMPEPSKRGAVDAVVRRLVSLAQGAGLNMRGNAAPGPVVLVTMGFVLLCTVSVAAFFQLADVRQTSRWEPSLLPPEGPKELRPSDAPVPRTSAGWYMFQNQTPSEALLPQPREPRRGSWASQPPVPSVLSSTSVVYTRGAPMASHLGELASAPPLPDIPEGRRSMRPSALQVQPVAPWRLCPGLVVPRGNECVLAVQVAPRHTAGSPKEAGPRMVDVLDLCGKPVLKVQVTNLERWPSQVRRMVPSMFGGSGRVPMVALRTLPPERTERPVSARGYADKTILASCYANDTAEGHRSTHIHDASGSLCALLARDPSRPRYILADNKGNAQMYIDGIFEEHAVLVSDLRQEQLADAQPCAMAFEPTGKYYRLRIASDVDVGLVLCALFSIDEMESLP